MLMAYMYKSYQNCTYENTCNITAYKYNIIILFLSDYAVKENETCSLHCLSFSNSHLTDEFWEILAAIFKGRQLPLIDINLNNNGDLTPKCMESIVSLTSGKFCFIFILLTVLQLMEHSLQND